MTPSYAGGSGTPLVLLHGVGGTWRVWRPVLPLLERWHAVFAPTLPGHCGAERLAAGVAPSIQALADGVVEQLDRAGIDRAHIAGTRSAGGSPWSWPAADGPGRSSGWARPARGDRRPA